MIRRPTFRALALRHSESELTVRNRCDNMARKPTNIYQVYGNGIGHDLCYNAISRVQLFNVMMQLSEENMDIGRFYTADVHCSRTTLGDLF